MKRAQKIAEENRKQEICVTYDLAIAKIALQLQEKKVPKFVNVFVALGGFHTEMAAFAVFGKYIAESDILNECNIIEKGSLKPFISGKGCKRTKSPPATCTVHGNSTFSIFSRIEQNSRNV